MAGALGISPRSYPYSSECVEGEFSEVEVLISQFLRSCASIRNPSYLPSLINSRRGRRVSPSLKEEVA
jgi:hypothetical protein